MQTLAGLWQDLLCPLFPRNPFPVTSQLCTCSLVSSASPDRAQVGDTQHDTHPVFMTPHASASPFCPEKWVGKVWRTGLSWEEIWDKVTSQGGQRADESWRFGVTMLRGLWCQSPAVAPDHHCPHKVWAPRWGHCAVTWGWTTLSK